MITDIEKNFRSNISDLNDVFSGLIQSQINAAEKNNNLTKILFKIKNDLERSLKNPNNLFETVCDCVDLCRANTPYYSTDLQKTKIDFPLTSEEKEQFYNKFKEQK